MRDLHAPPHHQAAASQVFEGTNLSVSELRCLSLFTNLTVDSLTAYLSENGVSDGAITNMCDQGVSVS